jgi:hypothetical protein
VVFYLDDLALAITPADSTTVDTASTPPPTIPILFIDLTDEP